MAEKSCTVQAVGFVETFKFFRSVVNSCFEQKLGDSQFKTIVKSLKKPFNYKILITKKKRNKSTPVCVV